MLLEGFRPYKKEEAQKYNKLRWWAGLTFSDILDKAADVYPDKEALVDGEIRLTYSKVREQTSRLAISLMELGIKPQDRVLLQLPNWGEFVYTYFALQKIGAIPVLLIDRYRQYEIKHLCRLTEPTAWLVPERYRKTDYLPIINGVLESNPQTKHVILVRGKDHEGFLSLEKLIDEAQFTEDNLFKLADRRPDPMQVAHMAPTGGTTGMPKVAPRTHNDYLCRVEYIARALELKNNDTCLVVAPVGHDLVFSTEICATIFSFGRLVMLDSTDPVSICREIQKEKITVLSWVPTLAYRLIHFEGLKEYDLSSLKRMYCGGGASSPDLIKEVVDRIGCIFINGYGGTEGMTTMTRLNYDFAKACLTVGKPSCPYDIYKIVDSNGQELPPNTPGELVVKGPGIFSGYYKSAEENEKVFDKDGFFKTGDQAMLDDSGDIVLTGRIREMINRGGESISAVEIENLIVTHPDVALVAVIGIPDPVMSERACACIQPKPGAKLSFEKIISFLKSKGASVLQLPERMEFIDSMPLTKTGKMDKKALVDNIKKKLGINI